jgi:glutamine amidotransferase
MISIVNYGLGNIAAFINIYKRLHIPASIASTPDELCKAERIILPGVGAFDWAMKRLNESGMRDELNEVVLSKHVPILGICVGMQILAQTSEEGRLPGLGWVEGVVKRFEVCGSNDMLQLPHMGWNTVCPNNNPLIANLGSDSRFYFLHSYYFECKNPSDTIAKTKYGIEYTSALNHEDIYGVQFHPEKSHRWGIQILKNFADL